MRKRFIEIYWAEWGDKAISKALGLHRETHYLCNPEFLWQLNYWELTPTTANQEEQ